MATSTDQTSEEAQSERLPADATEKLLKAIFGTGNAPPGTSSLSVVETRIGQLDNRLAGVETRVGQMDNRLAGVETRVGQMDNRLAAVEARVGQLDNRLGAVETRVGQVETRLAVVETKLGTLEAGVSRVELATLRLQENARTDFRLVFGALIATALGLAGMMAKGFHWI